MPNLRSHYTPLEIVTVLFEAGSVKPSQVSRLSQAVCTLHKRAASRKKLTAIVQNADSAGITQMLKSLRAKSSTSEAAGYVESIVATRSGGKGLLAKIKKLCSKKKSSQDKKMCRAEMMKDPRQRMYENLTRGNPVAASLNAQAQYRWEQDQGYYSEDDDDYYY